MPNKWLVYDGPFYVVLGHRDTVPAPKVYAKKR